MAVVRWILFTPDKNAASLTKAFHLQQQPSKVLVRLSDATGSPQVLLGVLEIQQIVDFTPEQQKALSFLPTNLPEGIEPADPMIDFRGRTYPFSVKARQ